MCPSPAIWVLCVYGYPHHNIPVWCGYHTYWRSYLTNIEFCPKRAYKDFSYMAVKCGICHTCTPPRATRHCSIPVWPHSKNMERSGCLPHVTWSAKPTLQSVRRLGSCFHFREVSRDRNIVWHMPPTFYIQKFSTRLCRSPRLGWGFLGLREWCQQKTIVIHKSSLGTTP